MRLYVLVPVLLFASAGCVVHYHAGPSSEAKASSILNPRRETRSVAYLGVTWEDSASACRIQAVGPESPAEAAGVRAGDAVWSVDGLASPTCAQVRNLIASKRPGDRVLFQFQRRDGWADFVEIRVGGRFDYEKPRAIAMAERR